MPRTARWVKVSVLSAFIAGISALSAASMLYCHCYAPILTEPEIQSASVTPNPTAGADSVTVEASASIMEAAGLNIKKAEAIIDDDTTQMQATDGAFDSNEEEFTAKLYVGDKEPGSTTVRIDVYNEEDEYSTRKLDLEITEE